MASGDIRYSYIVEWSDPRTDVLAKYELYVYPETGEVEMVKSLTWTLQFIFLNEVASTNQHCRLPHFRHPKSQTAALHLIPELLRPGTRVNILSRQLHILNYADAFTARELQHRQQRTLAMIKPDAVHHLPQIVQAILQSGFIIGELRMCHLSVEEAKKFYSVHQGKDFFERLVDFMISGRIVAIELLAPGAVEKWRNLLGPTDSNAAQSQAPGTIRASFGTDKTHNACHGSDSLENAELECDFFFKSKVGACWGKHKSSFCLIKNHALTEMNLIPILEQISTSFQITCAQTCHFTSIAAQKLLEVYKGVLPLSELNNFVQDLCSGNTLALEVSNKNESDLSCPVERLRELCGPPDPVTAAAVRPNSIRAQFGLNRVQNAVHCTDLEEDAVAEITKVFSA